LAAVRTLLNMIWLVLGGLWLAIGYVITGLICFVLIITIPFGIAAFRIAGYALWPFGRTAVRRADAGIASAFGNLIWLLVAGIWLAMGHIVSGILMCLTIVGIPLGVANFKMVPIALLPLGRVIVPTTAAYAYPYAAARRVSAAAGLSATTPASGAGPISRILKRPRLVLGLPRFAVSMSQPATAPNDRSAPTLRR